MAGFFFFLMLPYHYGILPRKYESFSTLLCLGLTKAYIKAETVAIFLNCPMIAQILPKLVHVNFIVE